MTFKDNYSKNKAYREVMFAKEYATNGMKGKEAALKAGFSPSSAAVAASNMLKKPHIQEYVNQHVEKASKEAAVTYEWKLRMLKRCVEVCLAEETEEKFNPNAAISAISELNKMQGDYAPVKSANINFNGTCELKELEELVDKYKRDY